MSAAGRIQRSTQIPYTARAFNPAHADLARSAGIPARLANEAYVEALARIIYYWGYAAVDQRGRHGMWQMLKDGPGLMFGILPGAPKNTTGGLNDYMPPSQRFVVIPNNDTFYGPDSRILDRNRRSFRRRQTRRRGITGPSRSWMPSVTWCTRLVRRPELLAENSCWSARTGRARSQTASWIFCECRRICGFQAMAIAIPK
jgi:hypothetical protein